MFLFYQDPGLMRSLFTVLTKGLPLPISPIRTTCFGKLLLLGMASTVNAHIDYLEKVRLETAKAEGWKGQGQLEKVKKCAKRLPLLRLLHWCHRSLERVPHYVWL